MVFHWILSDSKSPQVSRILLNILAVFNNAVVWMVSTRPPTSKSSRPFNNPSVTVPKAPITIGTIDTFMFHSFFQFSSKVEVIILLLLLLLLLLIIRIIIKLSIFFPPRIFVITSNKSYFTRRRLKTEFQWSTVSHYPTHIYNSPTVK